MEENNRSISQEDLKSDSDADANEEVSPEEQIDQELEDKVNEPLLRLQADFDNYRKRMIKERIENIRRSKENILLEILPILDNFNRALQGHHEDVPPRFLEGIQMVEKQFYSVLEKLQVQPIEAVGTQFDPHFHEAVAYDETSDYDDGIVCEELEKGYLCEGKVFRFTKVRVSKK